MSRGALKLSPIIAVLVIYLTLLSQHLQTRHPTAKPRPPPTPAEYASADSYRDIDMLSAIPRAATHEVYAIIGGSGFLGIHLVRLLLLRGETNIRILDLTPPPDDILSESAVSFVHTDITSLPSVRAALSQGGPPAVVFHMAAIIRFWERASYTWPITHKVNVGGTANVLAAVHELPTVKSLIYTSSGDAVLPRPHHWRLGYPKFAPPWDTVMRRDEDALPTGADISQSCYARSKKMAEELVQAANGVGNLKTGILRPSYTIIGVNDRMISSTLNLPRVPIFDKTWSQTPVNAWDVAAAHLLYEDALERKPDEVAGDAFFVSGPGPEPWTLHDVRAAIQHYSARPLIFQEVPPLAIFITAHVLEAFLYVRWHSLVPIYSLLGRRPSLLPRWLGAAAFLQPATLEYFADVTIDDARAQRVLGYRPQWSTLQTIKHVVDEFDSEKAGSKHGMQLGNEPEMGV